MATSNVIANLLAARDSVSAKLADVLGNPKPQYSIDGQSISWTEYYRTLLDAQAELTKQLAQLQPYSIPSQVM